MFHHTCSDNSAMVGHGWKRSSIVPTSVPHGQQHRFSAPLFVLSGDREFPLDTFAITENHRWLHRGDTSAITEQIRWIPQKGVLPKSLPKAKTQRPRPSSVLPPKRNSFRRKVQKSFLKKVRTHESRLQSVESSCSNIEKTLRRNKQLSKRCRNWRTNWRSRASAWLV